MRFDLASLLAEARASVQDPRAGARRVLGLNMGLNTAAMALAVVALLTALLTALVSIFGQAAGAGGMAQMTPLNWSILQVSGMFLGAGAIHIVGRWFGGMGDLPGALAVLAWSQFIMLIVQILQVAALILMPPVAVLIAIGGVLLTFWLLVNFIAELHGFSSLISVFFGILATGFVMVVLASILMAMALAGGGM